MKIRVTIDLFSGRENPVVELEGKEASSLLGRIRAGETLDTADVTAPAFRLGYRGLLIEQVGRRAGKLPQSVLITQDRVYGEDLAHRLDEPGLETYVLQESGLLKRFKLGKSIASALLSDLDALRAARDAPGPIIPPKPPMVIVKNVFAPVYEPDWWNDGGQRQKHNNCYNYSGNYRSDTFAQPGRATGAMYAHITGAEVKAGAVSDGLIDMPTANNKFPPLGHLVALVIWPGVDFHWYRKDLSGMWSHKPGSTPATNVDNSGNAITDPRNANRGQYTEFTTFMNVKHGHIVLK